MQQRTFFRGPMLITLDPPSVEAADLLVADGRIERKGWRLYAPPDVEVIDARGRILCPGLVNAHVRLDASFARTLPLPAVGEGEIDKLQAAETEESVIAAAFAVGLEAVRAGCTSLFNFHDGCGFVRGSLARIRDVMSTIGVRTTAACALTSRLSEGALANALVESKDAATFGCGGRTAFVLGAGDLARLPDSALAALADGARRYESPIHATIGPGPDAVAQIHRLRAAGLLRPHSVLLLLSPIPRAEIEQLAADHVALVHSASAEALASQAPRPIRELVGSCALGTDAGRPDLLEEARLLFARARSADPGADPRDVVALLAHGQRIASEVFKTRLGSFEPGSAADLVVLDYRPATPLTPATVPHHVLFGLSSAAVQHVMVDGHLVVRDRAIANVDVRNLFRQTQRGALDLWHRMYGGEFPGLGVPTRAAEARAEAGPRDQRQKTRKLDEADLEFEPLEPAADASRPWFVCKVGQDTPSEAPSAPPAPPSLPVPALVGEKAAAQAPAAAQTPPPTRKSGGGFGAGIL
jgi:cytosine/adenosine deaminase-related metal-dependent hydrolase